MQVMLIFNEPPSEFARRDDPAEAPAYWGAWTDYVRALAASGITRGGNGLMPPAAATTLRIRGTERLVEDGPFAETKEQLGGYFILEVAHLDEALDWAARSPAARSGSVEIRPVLPPPPGADGA